MVRLIPVFSAICGVALLAIWFAAPAEAAKRRYYQHYVVVYDSSAMKPRTRYVVRPRSFLDPGPELLPYSQHYTDYAFPADYSPYPPNVTAPRSYWRQPLPGPFEPGYNGAY